MANGTNIVPNIGQPRLASHGSSGSTSRSGRCEDEDWRVWSRAEKKREDDWRLWASQPVYERQNKSANTSGRLRQREIYESQFGRTDSSESTNEDAFIEMYQRMRRLKRMRWMSKLEQLHFLSAIHRQKLQLPQYKPWPRNTHSQESIAWV